MYRTTTETESVGRLGLSTGDCYNSQDTERITETRSASIASYVPPAGTDRPSDINWDPVPDRFDESTHEALVERLRTAADAVIAAIDSELPGSLQDQVTEWCTLHGFDASAGRYTQTLIARQAVLNLLLKATLYELHHRRGDLPPLPPYARGTSTSSGSDRESSVRRVRSRRGRVAR